MKIKEQLKRIEWLRIRIREIKSRSIILKKKLSFILEGGYRGNQVLSYRLGKKTICDLINSAQPFLVAKFGLTEVNCIETFILHKKGTTLEEECLMQSAWDTTGFFPRNDEKAFFDALNIYYEACKSINYLAIWMREKREINLFKNCCEEGTMISARIFSNVFFDKKPWTHKLEGKEVLVIHPFAETIKKQYKNRQNLFKNQMLPDFRLITYRCVQSIGAVNEEFSDFREAYEHMCNEIGKISFDIALIGAGAYGIPLGAFIKNEMEKQAIHIGGALQLFFGIKGGRWDAYSMYRKKIYNEFWIRPNKEETPSNNHLVDESCYW